MKYKFKEGVNLSCFKKERMSEPGFNCLVSEYSVFCPKQSILEKIGNKDGIDLWVSSVNRDYVIPWTLDCHSKKYYLEPLKEGHRLTKIFK